MVVQCCACLRVRDSEGWRSLEKPRIIEKNASHGYCPRCAEKAFAEIRAQQRNAQKLRAPAMMNL